MKDKPATGECRQLVVKVANTDKYGDVSVHYEDVHGQWADLFEWLEHQVKEHGRENVVKWMKIANEERKKARKVSKSIKKYQNDMVI